MKILIADTISKKATSSLKNLGAEVSVEEDLTPQELIDVIGDYNVLVVRATKVFAETIEAATALELIIRAGTNLDTIDVDAASDHGIYVANCPGMDSNAVAELTIGMIVAADRKLVEATEQIRKGEWDREEFKMARGLKGRNLAIVGFGIVGKKVAEYATALGMNVIVNDPNVTREEAARIGVELCEDLYQLAEKADVVSLHLASTSKTRRIIDRKFFDKMKDCAIFVNCASSKVVDSDALKNAIGEKKLKVALDVFDNEPNSEQFIDLEMARTSICTPRIGISTTQATDAIAEEATRIVKELIETGKPANTVNSQKRSGKGCTLVVRHYNKVGVLAAILALLRQAGINVENMDNCIFSGGKAAVATLSLDKNLQKEMIAKIDQSESVIQAKVN